MDELDSNASGHTVGAANAGGNERHTQTAHPNENNLRDRILVTPRKFHLGEDF
ncbi:hypothetical protein CPC16_000172, partial [Podila verticillata]